MQGASLAVPFLTRLVRQLNVIQKLGAYWARTTIFRHADVWHILNPCGKEDGRPVNNSFALANRA